MAERTVAHYAIKPALFKDIVKILDQIPGSDTRNVLNRIENLTGTNEAQAVFVGGDLGGHKKTGKKATGRKKSVARKKGGK